MKKTRPTAILLAAAIIVSSFGIVSAVDPQGTAGAYGDVNASHWAFKSIVDMSEKNVIAGYGDGTFKPAQTLTYGEFIKMMIVASTGQELQLAEKPNHWAYNYYRNGLERKLYSENDISKSMLDRDIPRKYMALIISNAMGDKEVIDYSQIEGTVKDVDSTVKYDYHIIKAYAEGILSGYADGSFKPDGTLTRAEATVVLQRFMEPEKRTPVSAEKPDNLSIVPITEGSAENRGSELTGIIQNSPSTKPIGEAISNWREIPALTLALNLKYYEIIADYPEKMEIVLGKFGGTEFLRMTWGNSGRAAVLIKDGKCIDYMTDYGDGITSYYSWSDSMGDKLPAFDYIGFFNSTGDTIILVPNPFKNGYTIAEKL